MAVLPSVSYLNCMSFFSRLFTRNITFIEAIKRDASCNDILHVFGAIRVMPDEGDSFDIYRYCVIDLNTYMVTNGIQQQGTSFSIKSAFAQRAIDAMSLQLNRQLALAEPKAPLEDEDGEEMEPIAEFPDLAEHCEFPVVDLESGESDTDVPKKLPRNCLKFTKHTLTERGERFSVQLIRSGAGMEVHPMSGLHDYFRHVIRLKDTGRLLCTYRKENWIGSGGMAFYVIDSSTGALLHDGMLK